MQNTLIIEKLHSRSCPKLTVNVRFSLGLCLGLEPLGLGLGLEAWRLGLDSLSLESKPDNL